MEKIVQEFEFIKFISDEVNKKSETKQPDVLSDLIEIINKLPSDLNNITAQDYKDVIQISKEIIENNRK